MSKHIHAFWHIEGMSYSKLEKIHNFFGNFQYAWEKAAVEEFSAAGLEADFSQQVIDFRSKLNLQKSMEILWKNDIAVVSRSDLEYPAELLNIPKSPFLLYRKGSTLDQLTNRMAIVGMRKATIHGEKLAFGLARQLVRQGVTVVSGLAFGIDAAAHEGSLRSDGKTLAILASGIGTITPATHHNLAERILNKGGAILSEYPVNAEALKFRFLERNRLIAGLSHTTVVVEAAKKSGALITAAHALEQGREILAFPGDPGKITSQGCNNLIKFGKAALVDSIADVQENLEDRGLLRVSKNHQRHLAMAEDELTNFDKSIINKLATQSFSTDELEAAIGKREQVIASLCKLEMAALIFKNSAMKWQLLAN